MAGERVKLEVEQRDARGSAEARRLRAQGLIPGVLYGSGGKAHPFCVAERELRRVLTGEHGTHAILDVVLGDGKKPHHAVLKDYQLHATKARLLHVDLHEVRLDQPIQSAVVVELVGEPEGVTMGGVLTQVGREINVEALPMEIPDRIEADISALAIGDNLRAGDLAIPDGVTLLDDPETVIASVAQPTRVELPEDMVDEDEAEALEDVPDEERPEGAADEPAEPGADAAGDPGTAEG
ncbi:MAG: 50S ribosomal protein L25 [Actinobacteria bacterium]|nr:50S ribosomal protein L25 [Actinomycetota bacterium]